MEVQNEMERVKLEDIPFPPKHAWSVSRNINNRNSPPGTPPALQNASFFAQFSPSIEKTTRPDTCKDANPSTSMAKYPPPLPPFPPPAKPPTPQPPATDSGTYKGR